MLGIPLESSNYALSNDVLKKLHFLTYVTALSTGTGFYITSLKFIPAITTIMTIITTITVCLNNNYDYKYKFIPAITIII